MPDSNVRPIAIFSSYMLLCLSLAIFIIRNLYKSYSTLVKLKEISKPRKLHILLFSGLAAASLATTWYYMLQYFAHSYRNWLATQQLHQQFFYGQDVQGLHLGRWLRDTKLFKEAWGSVLIGIQRFWWSGQIFLFASYLGCAMEIKGTPKGIRHTWAFMLLGQIVAISFVTNLFLLAVILNPGRPSTPKPSNSKERKRRSYSSGFGLLANAIVLVGSLSGMLLQYEEFHSDFWFMPLLLVPHVAWLILPILHAVVPPSWGYTDDGVEFAQQWINITVWGGGALFLRSTVAALAAVGPLGIARALYEHPAVSSVGWDTIFSWITWICWKRIGGDEY